MMHASTGILRYSQATGPSALKSPYKLVVEIDPEIARYYRWLIPAEFGVRKPMWPPHISLVRAIIPPDLTAWGKHEGREIGFEYDGWVHNDETYWWLKVQSKECEQIRVELGLSAIGIPALPPDGGLCFHCTIANVKGRT